MKITIAKHAGFCFGVRRAIDLTFKVREQHPGRRIFTVGPIIHNPQVIEALEHRGIGILKDVDDERLRDGDIAIIRAHGISPAKLDILQQRGVKIIDGTCPMVLKVHSIIRRASQNADIIAIAGDRDHPEMESHLGVAGAKGVLLETVEDVEKLPKVGRIALVAQTTFEVALFKQIANKLQEKAEVLDVTDTICRSTSRRQSEVHDLAKDHDTFIVIGGRNSANTSRLAELATNEGRTVHKVETGEQLKGINTDEMERVAIIAGASTPQWIIEDVIENLKAAGGNLGLRHLLMNIFARSTLCPALGVCGLGMISLAFSQQSYSWDILLIATLLALGSAQPIRNRKGILRWLIFTAAAFMPAAALGVKSLLLIAAVGVLRPLLDIFNPRVFVSSVYTALICVMSGILLPLTLAGAQFTPGHGLLIIFAAAFTIGSEILNGIKNMEKDAIMGRLSLARFLGEKRAIKYMEYSILGLAIALFVSFPVKLTPVLAYGLIPPLYLLAKGIDIYQDNAIYDNRTYKLYLQSIWLTFPLMGLLWLIPL